LNQVTVNKQATHLSFGSTPFLVTLTDADNRPMREQTIYFRVTRTNGPATELISALTNTQGQAQLNDLGSLPPGSYTLTASYGQLLDTPTHVTVLSDFRYLPASISSPLTINKKPPDCRLTRAGNDNNGHSFIEITTSDASGSGLASISAVTLQNADLPTPVFNNGTSGPVVVTATKQDQSQLARVELNILDVAGNLTDCDPFLVEVGSVPGVRRAETIHHVAHGESTVSITNLTPGLSSLRIVVNGRSFEVNDLVDGETRSIDISSAMRRNDNNTITVIAQGKAHGAAVVMIADSAPADAATPAAPVPPREPGTPPLPATQPDPAG
jgi:hypothetical protein